VLGGPHRPVYNHICATRPSSSTHSPQRTGANLAAPFTTAGHPSTPVFPCVHLYPLPATRSLHQRRPVVHSLLTRPRRIPSHLPPCHSQRSLLPARSASPHAKPHLGFSSPGHSDTRAVPQSSRLALLSPVWIAETGFKPSRLLHIGLSWPFSPAVARTTHCWQLLLFADALITPTPPQFPISTLASRPSRLPFCQNFSPRGARIPPGRTTPRPELRSLRKHGLPTSGPAVAHPLRRAAGRIPRPPGLPHHAATRSPSRTQDVHTQQQMDVGLHAHGHSAGHHRSCP
jgi:hypothetical protein